MKTKILILFMFIPFIIYPQSVNQDSEGKSSLKYPAGFIGIDVTKGAIEFNLSGKYPENKKKGYFWNLSIKGENKDGYAGIFSKNMLLQGSEISVVFGYALERNKDPKRIKKRIELNRIVNEIERNIDSNDRDKLNQLGQYIQNLNIQQNYKKYTDDSKKLLYNDFKEFVSESKSIFSKNFEEIKNIIRDVPKNTSVKEYLYEKLSEAINRIDKLDDRDKKTRLKKEYKKMIVDFDKDINEFYVKIDNFFDSGGWKDTEVFINFFIDISNKQLFLKDFSSRIKRDIGQFVYELRQVNISIKEKQEKIIDTLYHQKYSRLAVYSTLGINPYSFKLVNSDNDSGPENKFLDNNVYGGFIDFGVNYQIRGNILLGSSIGFQKTDNFPTLKKIDYKVETTETNGNQKITSSENLTAYEGFFIKYNQIRIFSDMVLLLPLTNVDYDILAVSIYGRWYISLSDQIKSKFNLGFSANFFKKNEGKLVGGIILEVDDFFKNIDDKRKFPDRIKLGLTLKYTFKSILINE